MKGFVAFLLGLFVMASATGCCCWNQPFGSPYQSCPSGVCPPGASTYPPTVYGTSAYVPAAPIATAPQTYYSNYPMTAFAPLESLPTY